MAILVVCPSCRARFQVSEKFAGKQGPCPKCKGVINIPALDEQVKIHEPEQFAEGGKDAKGRAVLKPVARVETKVQPVMVVGMVGAALMAFVIAWVVGRSHGSQAAGVGAGAGGGAVGAAAGGGRLFVFAQSGAGAVSGPIADSSGRGFVRRCMRRCGWRTRSCRRR